MTSGIDPRRVTGDGKSSYPCIIAPPHAPTGPFHESRAPAASSAARCPRDSRQTPCLRYSWRHGSRMIMPGSRRRTGGRFSRTRRFSIPRSAPPRTRRTPIRSRASAGTEALQERLVAEMRGRIKEDDSSVPEPDGPFAYFTRYREGGQHPLVCRQPRDGGPETIMLDGDKEAEGQRLLRSRRRRSFARPSPASPGAPTSRAREFFTIRVRDLETGADLPDEVPQHVRRRGVARTIPRGFYLCRARRESPSRPGQPPSPRHDAPKRTR